MGYDNPHLAVFHFLSASFPFSRARFVLPDETDRANLSLGLFGRLRRADSLGFPSMNRGGVAPRTFRRSQRRPAKQSDDEDALGAGRE